MIALLVLIGGQLDTDAVARIHQPPYAGTGVVAEYGGWLFVVTAGHVVDQSNRCIVETVRGRYAGTVAGRDKQRDCAVIFAELPGDHPRVSVGAMDRSPGAFTLAGYGGPSGKLRVRQAGGYNFGYAVMVDCSAVSGDSGGPVVAWTRDTNTNAATAGTSGPARRGLSSRAPNAAATIASGSHGGKNSITSPNQGKPVLVGIVSGGGAGYSTRGPDGWERHYPLRACGPEPLLRLVKRVLP